MFFTLIRKKSLWSYQCFILYLFLYCLNWRRSFPWAETFSDWYVEIKLQNLLFSQHVSGHHYAHHQELKNIIQVVAACGTWCLVYRLFVWCGAVGYVSGLRDAAVNQQPVNQSTKYHRQQPPVKYSWAPDDEHNGAPKYVERTISFAIRNHLLHLVGLSFPRINL